jgi:hypothetical protein
LFSSYFPCFLAFLAGRKVESRKTERQKGRQEAKEGRRKTGRQEGKGRKGK